MKPEHACPGGSVEGLQPGVQPCRPIQGVLETGELQGVLTLESPDPGGAGGGGGGGHCPHLTKVDQRQKGKAGNSWW